jgi:hypothetical protein
MFVSCKTAHCSSYEELLMSLKRMTSEIKETQLFQPASRAVAAEPGLGLFLLGVWTVGLAGLFSAFSPFEHPTPLVQNHLPKPGPVSS